MHIQSSQLGYELYNLKISFHSIQQHKFRENKCVILYFKSELVVLHATLSKFGNFLVYAWSRCGGLNKELSISVLQGQTHSCTSGHSEISLSLYETNMEYYSFKPTHQLQGCTGTYQAWKVLYANRPTSNQKPC